jgi:uncharacterized protein (AIM24 family)
MNYDKIAKNAEIIGADGSKYLKFKLSAKESIISSGPYLVYLKGHIVKGKIAADSFIRRAFSGQDALLDKYDAIDITITGGGKKKKLKGGLTPMPPEEKFSGSIAFGSSIIGDILMLKVEPETTYKIARGAFLASTDNITITGRWNPIGFIPFGTGDISGIITTIENNSQVNGYVWITSSGKIEEHKLYDDNGNLHNIIIRHGCFLACSGNADYKIVKLGRSIMATLLTDIGFGIEFTAQKKSSINVWTQSKDFDDFSKLVGSKIGTESSVGRTANDTSAVIETGTAATKAIGGIFSWLFGA